MRSVGRLTGNRPAFAGTRHSRACACHGRAPVDLVRENAVLATASMKPFVWVDAGVSAIVTAQTLNRAFPGNGALCSLRFATSDAAADFGTAVSKSLHSAMSAHPLRLAIRYFGKPRCCSMCR